MSCGAKHSLYNLFQALLDDGDEVVIPSPYWVSYPEMARLAGAVPVFAECREADGFVPTAAAVERALTPRTRLLVLNSPNNPTGAVLPGRALAEIAEVLAKWPRRRHRQRRHLRAAPLFERAVPQHRPARPRRCADRTVVINGVSKTFAMTGWRIGYAAGPTEVIAAMSRIQDQTTSNPTSFAQWGALAALSGPPDDVYRMRAEFDRRRLRLIELLRDIPGLSCVEPAGAFYAFPNIEPLLQRRHHDEVIGTDDRFCEILLDRGVAAVPGRPFGAPGHLRLSFALALEDIEKGVGRIAQVVSELQQ